VDKIKRPTFRTEVDCTPLVHLVRSHPALKRGSLELAFEVVDMMFPAKFVPLRRLEGVCLGVALLPTQLVALISAVVAGLTAYVRLRFRTRNSRKSSRIALLFEKKQVVLVLLS
jgi:membrane protein implicated in regulation of membrane protease activity